jgi:hypothetical protein
MWKQVGALRCCRFLLVLIALLLSAPAFTQDTQDTEEPGTQGTENQSVEGLLIEAKAVFNGYLKPGYYIPIKVTIENSGNARRGELRIVSSDPSRQLSAIFVADCDIPANSRKTFMLYPYLLYEDSSPEIYVQYYERNPLVTASVTLQNLREKERLWVEVSDEGYDFGFIGGIGLPDCVSFGDLQDKLTVLQTQSGGMYGYGGGYGGGTTPPDSYQFDQLQPVVVGCKPADLPDRPEGYHLVDGVILNTRRYYEMSDEQKSALTEYIISGGAAIVWLGDDPARYQGSFITGAVDGSGWQGPSAITEVPVRTTLAALAKLPAFLGNSTMLGDFPVTYTPQDSARTLLAEGATPILQHMRVGKGNLLLSGVDLGSMKRIGLGSLDDYFAFMVGYLKALDSRLNMDTASIYQTPYGSYGRQDTMNPYPAGSFYRILSDFDNVLQSDNLTALPGVNAIALFLFAYIVCIGPINYFVLLRMRRREWLWYSIPVLVTIFCVFSYGWALSTKGSRLLLTRMNIDDIYPGQRMGWETSSFGLFSPSATDYTIKLAGDRDLIRRIELPETGPYYPGLPGQQGADRFAAEVPLELVQDGRGGQSFVRNARIKIWSELHLTSDGAVPFQSLARLDNVSLNGAHLTGDLVCDLGFDLRNAFIICSTGGSRFTQVLDQTGDSPVRDGTWPFDLNIDLRNNALPNVNAYSPDIPTKALALRNAVFQAISEQLPSSYSDDEIILAGWRYESTDRALVSPRAKTSAEVSLVLVHMPLIIDSANLLVEGSRGTILAIKGDTDLETTGALRITNGRVLYSVTFPPVLNPQSIPDTLELDITLVKGDEQAPVETYVFDHNQGEWMKLLPVYENPTRQTLYLVNPERFFAPDHRSMFIVVQAGRSSADDDIISLTGITINVPAHGK